MTMPSGFVAAMCSYEGWRASAIPIVAEDLETKYEKLASSPFVFLRGTYNRFLQQFPCVVSEIAKSPVAVCVGDLHIENFGTWRDRDGRLAWGVNDLDELDLLPFTIDLVRLAASAVLAIRGGHLSAAPPAACETIYAGWRERIEERTQRTFILAERHPHLHRLAAEAFQKPARFARAIAALPVWPEPLPKRPRRLLNETVPWPGWDPQLRRRTAGLGSLGSRRIVAWGELDGGLIVREAKQIPGPASLWLDPDRTRVRGLPKLLMQARGAAADPWRRQTGKWVLRPLAPDTARLELASLRRKHDEQAILRSMGAEAANVHLIAHQRAAPVKALLADADSRPEGWLHDAASAMAALTEHDFEMWSAKRRRS